MNKLEERIKKFLEEKYPYEWLWKRRIRLDAILDYIKWNKEDNIARNTRRNDR
jgi:hypothetical protein